MKKRLFHGTGRKVSEVGLGCWQLGGSDWGELDDRTAFRILDAAAEAGVTFFDTADVYGGGRSEELIGAFLKDRHGCSLFVATKLGRTGALYPDKYTAAGLREATEASLKRLGVDALDLTQLHCVPTEVLRRGEIFGWLRDLQTAGKIKAWGASVETMDEALLCLEQEGLASLQIIFNVFRQKPVEAVLPQAREKNVAVIVRLPLASGLLSGKMSKETHFSPDDHRAYNRNGEKFNVGETFAGLPFETGVELADELRAMGPEGSPMAAWTQRWILDHDAVTVIIPGASRPQQACDNADVSALPPLAPECIVKSMISTAHGSQRTSGDRTEMHPAFADVPARQFALFGSLHLAILFMTLALPFALSRLTRREQRPRLARGLALTLAAILLFDRIFVLIWAYHVDRIVYWANALPMHLCDWATFAVIIALVGRRQLPYELAYLWGLSGTFQAVLTPDTTESPLNPLFISFFVGHCGIIVSVLFLTWGLGMRPGPGAVWRVWLCSQIYVVCAGLVNWLFRAHNPNFGYLAAKPLHGSLLDYFGPWPWYILTLEAMTLVFYVIFYAPFWFADRRRAAEVSAPLAAG